MACFLILQKGAPEITDLIILLIGVLFCLFAVNTLFEWLMTKPWKKSGTPTEAGSDECTQTDIHQKAEENSLKQSEQSDLIGVDQKILYCHSRMF